MTDEERKEFAKELLSNCNVTIHQFNIGDGYQNFYQQTDADGRPYFALAETQAAEPQRDVVYANNIFLKGNQHVNANLKRLRDDIGSCISGVRLADQSRYGQTRHQIAPSVKCQWYYVVKMIRESELLDPGTTDTRIIEQMMLWYPEAFETPQEMKKLMTEMSHSISAERKRWTLDGREVPFSEMNSKWQLLNISYEKKFVPMFSVCKDLKRLLDDFKVSR